MSGFEYRYRARVDNIESVYDGDTIKELIVDLGFGASLTIEGRLYGINTPEIWPLATRDAGTKARDQLRRFVADQIFDVVTLPDNSRDERRGKFGRWLVVIWIDTTCVNAWMLRNGLAVKAMYGDEDFAVWPGTG